MLDDKNEFVEILFQRYLDNKCTPAEVRKLLQYFDVDDNEELLRNIIRRQPGIVENATYISDKEQQSLLETTFEKIKQAIATEKESKPLVISIYRKLWFRMSAAAILVFLVSSATFYFFHHKDSKTLAKNHIQAKVKDIPPGTNNAVLTLNDGTVIVLDSATNGTLAQQGNIKVLKINGQIAYNKTGTGNMNTKPIYNTITTANGNEYQLILADGSKVWLNAASSIRFPASFVGNERKVEITGEAYFEVAHDASKPFKVEFKNNAGAGEIEVLGTHFDVNAYNDESATRTTLLEGSVKVSKGNESVLIKPGEQASVSSNSLSEVKGITVKKNADIDQVVAWKDGFFVFNNTDLQTIMRQVARWYNVQVNFEGKISADGYSGKISREVPLSKFLKVLELNGALIKTEERTVTVMQ